MKFFINKSILGGYYDDNYQYIPGEGWDETNQCYKNEIEDYENEDDDYGGKFF